MFDVKSHMRRSNNPSSQNEIYCIYYNMGNAFLNYTQTKRFKALHQQKVYIYNVRGFYKSLFKKK